MSTNSRFTIAIHVLTLLARSRAEPVTSEYIAASVNTNPVVIRRALAGLRAARLVSSQGGNGGGWRLAGDPEDLTLRAVYRAVAKDEALFGLHSRPPNPNCPVGRHIQDALASPFAAASRAMEDELDHTTVADVLRAVHARAG
ncbi:MAG TPA: Rrf2 family transcriptional regulator [Ktedonobacterales bacterium]